MQECTLGSFFATDLPREDAWKRAMGIEHTFDLANMPLNKLGIVIINGLAFPHIVTDGHHRLSRLLEVFGPEKKVFYEPKQTVNAASADAAVEINSNCGIPTLTEFLIFCQLQKFIGDE